MPILLKIYIILTLMSIFTLPFYAYSESIKEGIGKRAAATWFMAVVIFSFIPVISTMGVIFLIGCYTKEGIEKWIKNDPTSDANKNNVNFIPPPKKEKKPMKYIPIKTRSEILDL